MHPLYIIHQRNQAQVHKEIREALAGEHHADARRIARANPDMYLMDGRRRHVGEEGDVRDLYDEKGGEG